jgi:adenine-specific DNA-methyltransferase
VENNTIAALTQVRGNELSNRWIQLGILPGISSLSDADVTLVGNAQLERLNRLSSHEFSWRDSPPLPDDLFAPLALTPLGPNTCITSVVGEEPIPPEDLWLQLLPNWIDSSNIGPKDADRWSVFDLARHRIYTRDPQVEARWRDSMDRQRRFVANRTSLFARSANYMGSKAALSNQIVDIVKAMEPENSVIVDLMCGSGAMAGAFARSHITIASDAQKFSKLLALVQGGGMTRTRGEGISERVIQVARTYFTQLPDSASRSIEEEDRVLNSELTSTAMDEEFSKISRQSEDWEKRNLGSAAAVKSAFDRHQLFTHLYAGLYFGQRQAAELDCLRRAIDSVEDQSDRDWALGALVCAASACAYTYGGHFAQPKFDVSTAGKRRGDVREMLQHRAMSVTHEFFIRLTSLAQESEEVANKVRIVEGPWERALDQVGRSAPAGPVCVYLDPPYTRDEYSRYYHVLEALVRNEPQEVSGKGRLPVRGSPGRFASSFSARRTDVVEREIAGVLNSVLTRGWSCLWSYSNKGTASVSGTLDMVNAPGVKTEIFRMAHNYKAQGKRGAKEVDEYAIHLRPSL